MNERSAIHGVWCATLTPLDGRGAVDHDRFAAHVRDLFDAGVDGIAPFGTTGEGQSTMAEDLGVATTLKSFAIEVHKRFGCATVVTLGAMGALAVVGATLIHASAPVLQVIDATGAGDAFTGVLAAALHSGIPWNRGLAMSVAAGSLACTAVGAQAAPPAVDAIDFLATTVESNLVLQRLE